MHDPTTSRDWRDNRWIFTGKKIMTITKHQILESTLRRDVVNRYILGRGAEGLLFCCFDQILLRI